VLSEETKVKLDTVLLMIRDIAENYHCR